MTLLFHSIQDDRRHAREVTGFRDAIHQHAENQIIPKVPVRGAGLTLVVKGSRTLSTGLSGTRNAAAIY